MILLMTFKGLYGRAPGYIVDLLAQYRPVVYLEIYGLIQEFNKRGQGVRKLFKLTRKLYFFQVFYFFYVTSLLMAAKSNQSEGQQRVNTMSVETLGLFGK